MSESDFHIDAPRHLRAGDVRLSVHNKGPDDHEFLLVRTSGAPLAFRPDGTTVDEDAVEKATLAVVEPAKPGSVHPLRLRLRPGRYELLCNMSGHYRGGMHRRLVVQ